MKKPGAFTFELTRAGIEARIVEMEKKLERLRSLYESFFMGIERRPPNTPRQDMNRLMLEMQQVPIANSSLRFRFQALSQRWVLLVTYWNRTMREIEAGTFRRDLARAQRHMAERGGMITEEEALALGVPKNRVKAFVARQQLVAEKKKSGERNRIDGAPPAPAGPAVPSATTHAPGASRPTPPPIPGSALRPSAPPTSPPETGLPGLARGDLEDAYQRYVEAHRQLGIEPQAKPLDKIRQQLTKQLPKIMQDRNCSKMRLEVAIEEGKVRLRAWPVNH